MAALGGRRFRIYERNAPNQNRSIMVQSDKQKLLVMQSSAILTYDDNETTTEYKAKYQKVTDAHGILGIIRLSKEDPYLAVVTEHSVLGETQGCDIHRILQVSLIPLESRPKDFIDPRAYELQQFLSTGKFYYVSSKKGKQLIDFTRCTQARHSDILCYENDKNDFFWNRSMHYPFIRFGVNPDEWLLKVICGSVFSNRVYVGHRIAKVALISRLSCLRAGARFHVRGIDESGNVANFIETEQVIELDEKLVSYIVLRGSVPLFWSQPGINVGGHKVKLRSFEAAGPALSRHFNSLRATYGKIAVVNLLGERGGEGLLSRAYRIHCHKYFDDMEVISFDYHAKGKNLIEEVKILMKKLSELDCSYFASSSTDIIRKQNGAFRVNCLDCIDRTNAIQTEIGLFALELMLHHFDPEVKKPWSMSRFTETFRIMWKSNGDHCSMIYAGTGAMEGKSKLKDASRSLARTFQNNFLDDVKQELFELLLHGPSTKDYFFLQMADIFPRSILHECPGIAESLLESKLAMTEDFPISIFVGTYNLNGGKKTSVSASSDDESISKWLFTGTFKSGESSNCPDVYVIGFEEIIDLTAQNIVNPDALNARAWFEEIRSAIWDRHQYVLIACEQLVGICLFILMKPAIVPFCRDTSVESVKTGLGGAMGNKGSVAVRLTLFSTTFCFVCSHFSAGTDAVQIRNAEYATALKKIRFRMDRDILSHDVVIWMGDFNYRTATLSRDAAVELAQKGDIKKLLEYDQLTQQRSLLQVFNGFEEGHVNFPPTYKYDLNSDVYDSSEKARIPSWTDRVLWRDTGARKAVELLQYGRVELKISDHRPVYALFNVKARRIVRKKCEDLYKNAISSSGPPDGTVILSFVGFNEFPAKHISTIISKLNELGVCPSLCNVEGAYFRLVFSNGVYAIIALSLNEVVIDGVILKAEMLSKDWVETEMARFVHLMDKVEELANDKCHAVENAFEFNFVDEENLKIFGSTRSTKERNIIDTNNLLVQTSDHRSQSSPMLPLNRVSILPSCDEISTLEPIVLQTTEPDGNDSGLTLHLIDSSHGRLPNPPPVPSRPKSTRDLF